jgi:hypothetical protein
LGRSNQVRIAARSNGNGYTAIDFRRYSIALQRNPAASHVFAQL